MALPSLHFSFSHRQSVEEKGQSNNLLTGLILILSKNEERCAFTMSTVMQSSINNVN